MGVNYYLEKRKNKKGECPVRVQVCFKGVVRTTTAGISINPKYWNGTRVKRGNYSNSKSYTGAEINMQLNRIENYFLEWAKGLREKPDTEAIASQMAIALGRVRPREGGDPDKAASEFFYARLDEFVAKQSQIQQWAFKTVLCWRNFRHLMESFDSQITFEDMNENGIDRFVTFLRQEKQLEDSTVHKEYKFLRSFIHWAVRKGYTTEDTAVRYKPKFKMLAKPIVFLTGEELSTLYNYQIPPEGSAVHLVGMNGVPYVKIISDSASLELARDLFCFCCLTSLRFSDMQNLKKKDIVENRILITTQKTNDRIQIELNQYSKAILRKYSGDGSTGLRALPRISNRRMNQCVKDLCELCGFNEPISKVFFRAGNRVEETHPKWEMMTTHVGRKTFVCLALSSGIPPQVVMKWTGHSDYKAMKPYIDIAEKTKSDAMDQFSRSLFL